ncbi:MAG: ABC transporter permease [Ruminococcus sp.]|nr:ABC transporter permease [Ruminococcus sp.]
MKSIKRGERLTIIIIAAFLIGMIILVVKIIMESSFYMSHSTHVKLGNVYDCNGEILFDSEASLEKYKDDANYFIDIGNVIGDDSGQMTNTLVSENINKLQNYNLLFGATKTGKSSIHATLNHAANRKVYEAFGNKDGTAIAYNYKTGEILICVSKPSVNILNYENVSELPSGSLMCKAFYGTVPGSTQKVSTLAAAIESIGYSAVSEKVYNCPGTYYNNYGTGIDCHDLSGHGVQNISQALQNSCNPFFAQLVEELPLDGIINTFRDMGYSVNKSKNKELEINGISIFRASTELTDVNDSITQWGCIGQGKTEISPCQLMMWQSAIANGTDKVTMPYLIDYSTNIIGITTHHSSTKYESAGFSSETSKHIREIMLENGRNNKYSSIGRSVGVKTGTAQVENGKHENSLLVGFCDEDSLPIAFCIVIEKNESQEMSTNQIAAQILNSLSES